MCTAIAFWGVLHLTNVTDAYAPAWSGVVAMFLYAPANIVFAVWMHRRAVKEHRVAMARLGAEITKVQQRKKKARQPVAKEAEEVVLDDFRIVSEEDVSEDAPTRPLRVVDPYDVPDNFDAGQF